MECSGLAVNASHSCRWPLGCLLLIQSMFMTKTHYPACIWIRGILSGKKNAFTLTIQEKKLNLLVVGIQFYSLWFFNVTGEKRVLQWQVRLNNDPWTLSSFQRLDNLQSTICNLSQVQIQQLYCFFAKSTHTDLMWKCMPHLINFPTSETYFSKFTMIPMMWAKYRQCSYAYE